MLQEFPFGHLPVLHVRHARFFFPGLQDGGFALLVARPVVGAVAHDVLVQMLAQMLEECPKVAASQSLLVAESQAAEGDAGGVGEGVLWVVVQEAEAHLLAGGVAPNRARGPRDGAKVTRRLQLVARKDLDRRVVTAEFKSMYHSIKIRVTVRVCIRWAWMGVFTPWSPSKHYTLSKEENMSQRGEKPMDALRRWSSLKN